MDNTTPTVQHKLSCEWVRYGFGPCTCAKTDPRPFLRHMTLASLWCQYNGQRGTERQTLRVMRQLTAADLVRMLTERGVVVPADCVVAS